MSYRVARYYPDAEDVYKGAATVTADEDAQGLEEPIIAPVKTKTFSKLDREVGGPRAAAAASGCGGGRWSIFVAQTQLPTDLLLPSEV